MAAVAGAGGLPELRRGRVPLLSPAGPPSAGLGVAVPSTGGEDIPAAGALARSATLNRDGNGSTPSPDIRAA